jgi:hypothetical protein
MKPMRTCKEATALMVAQEDRTLNLGDRMALRLHLAMCKACPRFQAQMLNMRNSFKAWRNYSERD